MKFLAMCIEACAIWGANCALKICPLNTKKTVK